MNSKAASQEQTFKQIISALKKWSKLNNAEKESKVRIDSHVVEKSGLPEIELAHDILCRNKGVCGGKTTRAIDWLGSAANDGTGYYIALLNELSSGEVLKDIESWQNKAGDLKSTLNKSNNDTTSLEMFIEKYCKCENIHIKSKVKTLQSYARKKKIKLPKLGVKWTQGQAKLYLICDLVKNWSSYRRIMPALPELK